MSHIISDMVWHDIRSYDVAQETVAMRVHHVEILKCQLYSHLTW